jgi:hypothetical protein
MTRIGRFALLWLSLAVFAGVCSASATTAQWIAATPPFTSGFLTSISADSPTDVWALGLTAGAGPLFRYNGSTWSSVSFPKDSGQAVSPSAVDAVSPSNVWVAGIIETTGPSPPAITAHWDGQKWTFIPVPKATTIILNSISVVPRQVTAWAVGETQSTSNPVALFYNGATWARVPTPGGPAELDAVAARLPTDAWAVGQRINGFPDQLVEHWNGSKWIDSPDAPNVAGHQTTAVTVIPGTTHAWIVGNGLGEPEQPYAELWNGTTWTATPIPSLPTGGVLSSVAADSATDAWAVGVVYDATADQRASLIEHWNGTKWARVAAPPVPYLHNPLMSVSAVPGTDELWAVGTSTSTSGGDQIAPRLLHHPA